MLLTNPVVISIVVLLALSLLRINVVIALRYFRISGRFNWQFGRQ